MNFFVKWTLLLAVAVTISAVRADDLAVAANPYSAIAERNVFALVPIPTNPPVSETPLADPPPKITPNGTMSIFGKVQALFKVTPKAMPNQPAKDISYVMAEGERQDEIEVVKIDEEKRVITFNNHGTVQELALVDAPKQTIPAPSGSGVGGTGAMLGGAGVPAPGASAGANLGSMLGRAKARAAAAQNTGDEAAPSLANAAGGGVNPQANKAEELSPEAQVIMIEANRLATQDLVDQGKMPPLPPTLLTPTEATGVNGSPLIVPGETVPPAKK